MKEKIFSDAQLLLKARSSFHSDFAQLLLLHQNNSKLFELSLVIIEYIQLISQIILTSTKASASIEDSIINYILKGTDIVNIGYYIGSQKNAISEVALILILCYVLAVYSSIVYLIVTKLLGRKRQKGISAFVGLTLKVHGRVIFYFIVMCVLGWLKVNFNDFYSHSQTYTTVFVTISIVLLIFSYALGVAVWAFYSYMLPSKSSLAAISYSTELFTQTQKLIQGILFITLPDQSIISTWVIGSYSMVIGILRAREFLMKLPNYNLRVLFWKGSFITTIFTLNLCFFAFNVQSAINGDQLNIISLIMTWLILLIFTQILYNSYYKREVSNILLCSFAQISPKKLIHKVHYLKQVKQMSVPFQNYKQKDEFWNRTLVCLDKRKKSIFGISEDWDLDAITVFENSIPLKCLFLRSLQDSLMRYPKADDLRLYCAYYFGKKLGLYGASMKLLESLEKSSWHFSTRLNAKLLRSELQDIIKTKQVNGENSLNVVKFISTTRKMKDIKNQMSKQAGLQLEIYKEWSTEKFDMGKIQKHSLQIERHRAKIESQIKNIQKEKPDYYLEPLVLFAYYAIQVNFSPTEYLNYMYTHAQKLQRYQVKLSNNNLTHESLYNNKNIELILSTKLENSGVVLSCSSNSHKVLGWNPNFMIGKSFSSLAPPSLNRYYQDLITKAVKSDSEVLSAKNNAVLFITHSEGHVIPVNYYLSLYPVLDGGVFLHVILRPIVSIKDYIIVTKDGFIESYTHNIGKEMNLAMTKTTKVQIGRLNSHLANVNTALNALLSRITDRDTDMSFGESHHSYDNFSRLQPSRRDQYPLSDRLQASLFKRSYQGLPVTETGREEWINTQEASLTRTMLRRTATQVLDNQSMVVPELPEEELKTFGSRKSSMNNDMDASITVRPVMRRRAGKILTAHKAQTICQDYLSEGKCLDLVPLTSKNKDKTMPLTTIADLDNEIQGIEYCCSVENRMYGETNVKLFMLEQVQSNSVDCDDDIYQERNSQGGLTTKTEGLGRQKAIYNLWDTPKDGESEYSGNFDTEEEKNETERKQADRYESGTKDTPMESLNTGRQNLLTFSPDKEAPTDRGQTERSLIKTGHNTTKRSPHGTPQNALPPRRRSQAYSTLSVFKSPELKHIYKEKLDKEEQMYSTGSTNTRTDDKKIYGALKRSLDFKYYSVKTNVFIWVFYILIVLFIASQLITSFDSRSKFHVLTWQKEILVNAETRNDLILRVQKRFRSLWLIPGNIIPESDLNKIVPNARNLFLNLVGPEITQLAQANNNLLLDSSFLGDKERKTLFTNNVRVYSSDEDNNKMNTIQATELLVELSIQALTISKVNLTAALPTYYLIFQNSLNDILVESRNNIQAVSTLLDDSRAEFLTQTKAVFAIVVVFFILMIIGTVILYIRLYHKEVNILSSLPKIDKTFVLKLASEMVKFKNNLSEETYYEETNLNYMIDYSKHLLDLGITHEHNVKQENILINKKMLAKYGRELCKNLIFFVLLGAFIALDRVLILTSINKLYSHVDKIRFMKQLSEEIALATMSYVEIMSANGTTTIMNEPSEQFYTEQVAKFTEFRDQTPSMLENDDHSVDPFIEEALSGNGCVMLSGNLVASCKTVVAGAQGVGLLRLMAMQENLVRDTVDTFLASNRTAADSSSGIYKAIGLTVPVGNVVTGLIDIIFSYLETRFDEEVEAYSKRNVIMNSVGLSILGVSSVLLWIFILKDVRECDNNLKKILKNFPLNVVLKNYKLRGFMWKTSRNSLDSLKNKL